MTGFGDYLSERVREYWATQPEPRPGWVRTVKIPVPDHITVAEIPNIPECHRVTVEWGIGGKPTILCFEREP